VNDSNIETVTERKKEKEGKSADAYVVSLIGKGGKSNTCSYGGRGGRGICRGEPFHGTQKRREKGGGKRIMRPGGSEKKKEGEKGEKVITFIKYHTRRRRRKKKYPQQRKEKGRHSVLLTFSVDTSVEGKRSRWRSR